MHTTPAAERVAREVRAEVARQQISQSAVAGALGMSQASVSRRLAGRIPFDVAQLHIVAALLNVPATQFLVAA